MAIQKKSLKEETPKPAQKRRQAPANVAKPDVRLTKRHNLSAYPPDPCIKA